MDTNSLKTGHDLNLPILKQQRVSSDAQEPTRIPGTLTGVSPSTPPSMERNVDGYLDTLNTAPAESSEPSIAVEALASLSKQDVRVRQRLANVSSLTALVSIIQARLVDNEHRDEASSTSPSETTKDVDPGPRVKRRAVDDPLETVDHALRCIANACADNNPARQTMTDLGFSWATTSLHVGDEDLSYLTIQVLYNICLDFEPAQQQCYREKIHFGVLRFFYAALESPKSYDMDNVVDLAFLITGHKPTLEPLLTEPIDTALLGDLLATEESQSAETHAALIETTLVFLRDTNVQEQIIQNLLMEKVWHFIARGWATIANSAGAEAAEGDGEDLLKMLLPLGTSLVWIASDIAARPNFATAYPSDSPLIKELVRFLVDEVDFNEGKLKSSDDETPKEVMVIKASAACHILGNLLWALQPHGSALWLEQDRLDAALFVWILCCDAGSQTSDDLSHAVSRLLIHLSRPSVPVRERMARDVNALPALERLCRHAMPEVKQDGVKLLRALGKDSPANQDRFAALEKEVMQAARQANEGASQQDVS